MTERFNDSFAQFYRDNLRPLRRYIARLLPNAPAEAEDIANEAFARVLASAAQDSQVPPKSYLFSAAHNLTMNQHRRHKVRGNSHLDQGDPGNIPDPTPSAERDLIARERLTLLWEAIDQLPPRARQVFLMRKMEHLPNSEIARRLGLSVSAVEKHIVRGLRACHNYLAARETMNEAAEDAVDDLMRARDGQG